jgi:alkylation response protein AidB-like acyl-CoA dehydrogenase
MDFDFNEEQYMLRDSVRGMLDAGWSIARTRALVERDMDERGTPADLSAKLAELGLPAMLIPESYGGLGLTFLDYVLVAEEFGRTLAPAQITQSVIASEVIGRYGSEAQKTALLPRLATGEAHAALAWLEPEAGYDPADIAMTARETANGYSLSGRKILAHYGDSADILLVAARLPDGEPSLFTCEGGKAGISTSPHMIFDPSSRAASLQFDNVELGADALLDSGALARFLDLAAVASAAEMAGCASAALDMAVAYAGQRQQFGQLIGSFQAIKHKCADMIVALETSRSAAYYAAWAISEDVPDAASAVSMAKAYCGDSCRMICNEALQIHGGIGYTWELDVHLFLKRGKYLEYSFGDASFHRERVIAHAMQAAGV